jgi:hypothetical protein
MTTQDLKKKKLILKRIIRFYSINKIYTYRKTNFYKRNI